jgi:hypothetical protein
MRNISLAAVAVFASFAASAQNTLTFSASTTTGDGSVVPVLTWSTQPAAQSCVASGAADWAGAKAASGTQTLPAVSISQTYNLECTWPGDAIETLTWTNPGQNTDGSPYTDRGATVIRWRFENDPRTDLVGPGQQLATLLIAPANGGAVQLDPAFTTHTVTGLTQLGEQRFAAYACNMRAVCSEASNLAAKPFTGMVTVTESVGITVNPVPGPITGLGAL